MGQIKHEKAAWKSKLPKLGQSAVDGQVHQQAALVRNMGKTLPPWDWHVDASLHTQGAFRGQWPLHIGTSSIYIIYIYI